MYTADRLKSLVRCARVGRCSSNTASSPAGHRLLVGVPRSDLLGHAAVGDDDEAGVGV
jgi:hypothetical protein